MTGWLVFLGLALLVGGALFRWGRLPKGGMELVGAALFVGVAGYAWQGSPALPGKPTPPPESAANLPDTTFALERGKMLDRFGTDAQVLGTADAFHRQGLNTYAIGIIKGGLSRRPNSPDLWVGLGNALVIHGQGMMSPAAQLAFERAGKLAPDHPGPPFFLGLAYAQAGQLDRAAKVWSDLLARSPADAPWRPELEQRLGELAQMQGGGGQQ
ncbi:tetratricopeptide repeat protein [Sphingomonas montanisoli]|uniref:Cytochrome C biogenesis protein n=1 Tax=Sphingomonas montanisoli TaxID=2606412 RepID=A0A5D9CBQ6_9SPHN|nr:cytochrome C biogenesis protein [Sphingomonas montanisoli]TZG28737.1 cytochrome C biogenesis protein [Sphingomonas montanisoli]